MKNHRRGFTLLEVIIAITILAILMVFSNQSIQNGMKAKTKIHDQLEEMSQVRDALRIMLRDCHNAFHYRDIELEYKKAVQQALQSTPQPGPNPSNPANPGNPGTPANPAAGQASQQALQQMMQQWMAKDPTRVDPTTQFIGTSDKLHFVTMNAGRMSENQAQADFVKVGYFLTSCHRPGSNGPLGSGKCLVRSEGPLIETDITVDGPQTTLLENVTEFKLRYIGVGRTDWVSEWNSKNGDGSTTGNFPDSVEISLTTMSGEGAKQKKVSMQIVAPLHFANNDPNPKSSANTNTSLPVPAPNGNNNSNPNSGPIP